MIKPFFKLQSTEYIQAKIKEFSLPEPIELSIDQALGHVIACNVTSPEDLPPFRRSTMDGYAVNAADTFGASESQPAIFEIAGEISMGSSPGSINIRPGQAARIWTGGELPGNADAVIMVEYTETIDARTIEVFRSVSPLENVIEQGEDVQKGMTALNRGTLLRPQELGLLAGLGINCVKVLGRPVVAIISTGDELVPADTTPPPGKIRDINSTTLAALVRLAGGTPVNLGIIQDTRQGLINACSRALAIPADAVLISGGSSVGMHDFTIEAFRAIQGAEIVAHGVSIKPGKPTILAKAENQALFGLPGHVASAMVVFYLFVYPLLRQFQGFTRDQDLYLPETTARISRNYPSQPGREEYVRVRLSRDDDSRLAHPVFGKSGLIRPLVEAHGLLIIHRDSEGLYTGDIARVLMLP